MTQAKFPQPTPIFRIIHIDNLPILLQRRGLHAPNHTPDDGLVYKTIHNRSIQSERNRFPVRCGPRGVIHDYVSFYFGARSPMLFQLDTNRVSGHQEGEDPIIYLVSTAQAVSSNGLPFVFTDGHGIATFTNQYDDLAQLCCVDWEAVKARFWKDSVEDPDRQRRKQAEFLIYKNCDWSLIQGIGVRNARRKTEVEAIMSEYEPELGKKTIIRPEWYYNR